jgi:hypothetical protein
MTLLFPPEEGAQGEAALTAHGIEMAPAINMPSVTARWTVRVSGKIIAKDLQRPGV